MTPPVLSAELLEELRLCWVEQEAPVLGQLRAGLAGAEMASLTTSLEMGLPTEARVWWGWHDGSERSNRPVQAQLGPMLGHLSLEQAIDLYRNERRRHIESNREVLDRIGRGDLSTDDAWPEGWLPVAAEGNGDLQAIDVRGETYAPVHLICYEDPFPEPVTSSLGELVLLWIGAMRSGAWTYDSSRGDWITDKSLLPADLAPHPYFL